MARRIVTGRTLRAVIIGPMDRLPTTVRERQHMIAITLAMLAALFLLVTLARFLNTVGWGFDFESYFHAGQRLARGDFPIYHLWTLEGQFRPGPYDLYLYAPPLAVAMMPFTMLSLPVATLLWFGIRVALLVVACALMPVRPTIRLLAFAVAAVTSPVLIDLNLGNISVVVMVLLAFVWRGLDRPAGSIILAVAITVRPTLGILLGWWVIRRCWRPLVWTIGAGLMIILVTLPFTGYADSVGIPHVSPPLLHSWEDYVTVLRNVYDVTGVDNNLDLGSTVLNYGLPVVAALAALYGGYVLAAVAVVWSLRYDRELSFMVTVGATMLLAPLLWDHYLAILVLPAAFLAQRGRPWGLGLPLLAWLPNEFLPFLAIAATVLPFLAPPAVPPQVPALARWRKRPDDQAGASSMNVSNRTASPG